MITRTLQHTLQESPKSILLLGPRQTGKTTLIQALKPDLQINLSDEREYLEFVRNPSELPERLEAHNYQTIFIDEVQKIPSILNTLQMLIDRNPRQYKFYLTGSSARKLKRGNANLLPGRIFTYNMGGITFDEMPNSLDTSKALSTGMLPESYLHPNEKFRIKLLRSYASTYLKEEIQAEALTRNLEGFSRFLFIAAARSGQFLDLTKLASESKIARQTAVRFFEILEDTLIIQRCPMFSKNISKRLIKHPRYFFFDTGVLNALLGNFYPSLDRKGNLFEHLIFNQILHNAYALDLDLKVSSFRTSSGIEVDFIVEYEDQVFAIEVKHTSNIGLQDLKGLKNFAQSCALPHQPMVFYQGNTEKKIDGIPIFPWQIGLNHLFHLL